MRFLKREQLNALVNIAAKVLVGLVPLAFVPVYVRYLGMHGYGVFAYALTLIGLSSIFDLGLSPALTRAVSQVSNRPRAATVFKTFELTYFALGAGLLVIGALILAMLGDSAGSAGPAPMWIWVSTAALIACSWPVTLYSGALLGADQQIRLNMIMFAGVIVRFLGGAALLAAMGPNPVYLLLGHAGGFFLTGILLRQAVRAALPPGGEAIYDPAVLQQNFGFAAKTWMIGGIIIACGQLDKQVIATSFGLAVFSSYSIAWTVSAAASNMAHPIGSSYFPRSVAAFETGEMTYLRRAVTEALAILILLIVAPCAFAASFASDVLSLWLGNAEAAKVEPFLVPLLYAAQLGAICALAQSFLTSFGKVGVIVWVNLTQLAIMAAGIVAILMASGGSATEIAFLWILVQGAGAVSGVYLTARGIGVAVGPALFVVTAAVLSVDACTWGVARIVGSLPVAGYSRLFMAISACCVIAAIFLLALRFLAVRWEAANERGTTGKRGAGHL